MNWCITGQRMSPQGEKALIIVGNTGLEEKVLETAGAIGVAAATTTAIVVAPIAFGLLLGAATVGVSVLISNIKRKYEKKQ